MARPPAITYKRSPQEAAQFRKYEGRGDISVASPTLAEIYPQYQHAGKDWIDPQTGIHYRREDTVEAIILKPTGTVTPRTPGFTGAGERTTPYVSLYAKEREVTIPTGEYTAEKKPTGETRIEEVTKTVKVPTAELKKYAELSGEAQFKKAQELGFVPQDSKYVEGEVGEWGYIPEWSKQEKQAKEFKTQAEVNKQLRAQEKLNKQVEAEVQTKSKPRQIPPRALAYWARAWTEEIPQGASAKVTSGQGTETLTPFDLKRFGKSFVPGWLTKEDWKYMTPLERAASIAGDIGQTILYVIPAVQGGKILVMRQPAPALRGTFPKDAPGLRVVTQAEAKNVVKNLVVNKDLVSIKAISKTVPIEVPVKMPLSPVTIVEETPAGFKFIRPTQPYKPDLARGAGGSFRLYGVKEKPPGLFGLPKPMTTKGGLPTKGGATTRETTTATMTTEQVLRRAGLSEAVIKYIAPLVVPSILPAPKVETIKISPATVTTPSKITTVKGQPGITTKGAPSTKASPAPGVTPSPALSPGISPTPAAGSAPSPAGAKATAPAPSPAPAPAPKPAPKPAPEGIPRPASVETTTAQPVAPVPGGPIPQGKYFKISDKEARQVIIDSDGAIAWRQGQVGGKDRWDTVVYPYGNKDYLMVIGNPPEGATIVRKGKGSARATAQMLRGEAPKKQVRVDSGFQDIIITPTGRRGIILDFKPDPKMQTTGDITIGTRTPRISERLPRITGRSPRISSGPVRISR